MKITDIRNITASAADEFSGRFSVGWEDPAGNRYHVWGFRDGSIQDMVFKNPPGYFPTRHLDPDRGGWREVIAEVVRGVVLSGAVQKATAEAEARKAATLAADRAQRANAIRLRLFADAGSLTDFARQGVLRLVDHASDDDLLAIASTIIFNA